MSTKSPPEKPAKSATTAPQPYEPPRIAWVEPYEPLGFGVSCLKTEGVSACLVPGPLFT